SSTITVTDAALEASGTFLEGTEGQSISGTVASFTDLPPGDPAGSYTATISWGDNTEASTANVTGSNGNYEVSGEHTYVEEGQYTLTITIVDADIGLEESSPSPASATVNSTV